jgi:hypothetical protein
MNSLKQTFIIRNNYFKLYYFPLKLEVKVEL